MVARPPLEVPALVVEQPAGRVQAGPPRLHGPVGWGSGQEIHRGVGVDLLQPSRDGEVPLDVAETDRARQPQDAARRGATRTRRWSLALGRGGNGPRLHGPLQDEVAFERDEARAGDGGDHPRSVRVGHDLVEGAVEREGGHRDARKQVVDIGAVDGPERLDEHIGRGLARPRHAVLDPLERVGLREDAGEEALPVGGEVAAHHACDFLLEGLGHRLRVLPAEQDQVRDVAGVVDHIPEGNQGRAGVGGEGKGRPHRLLQHREQVAVAAIEVVPGRRPVGTAIASRVGGDHAEVAREVRDLGLELPAVGHRLALGQQEQVAVAATRGLPEELDSAIAHIHGLNPPLGCHARRGIWAKADPPMRSARRERSYNTRAAPPRTVWFL